MENEESVMSTGCLNRIQVLEVFIFEWMFLFTLNAFRKIQKYGGIRHTTTQAR